MFFGTKPIPEMRIALFGQRGAGKSTLLASYYGHQQSHAFNKKHCYQLRTNASAGNKLLSSFYTMQEGSFPDATQLFSEYAFDLLVYDVPKPSLRITWYDYPGGWWTESPSTAGEASVRIDALAKLLTSHIGVLLLDGDKYRKDGAAYVCSTLAQFRQEILRLRDECAATGKPVTNFPRDWVVAISKADLFPESFAAADAAKDILAHAIVPLEGIRSALDSQSFGSRFLLLSSAKGDGSQVVDASKYVGLQLVAPIALAPTLSIESQRYTGALGKTMADWLMRHGPGARHWLQSIAIRLPGKYRVVAMALLMLASDEKIEQTAEKLKEWASIEAKKGKTIEAAAALLAAELKTPEAERAFHQSQRDSNS